MNIELYSTRMDRMRELLVAFDASVNGKASRDAESVWFSPQVIIAAFRARGLGSESAGSGQGHRKSRGLLNRYIWLGELRESVGCPRPRHRFRLGLSETAVSISGRPHFRAMIGCRSRLGHPFPTHGGVIELVFVASFAQGSPWNLRPYKPDCVAFHRPL